MQKILLTLYNKITFFYFHISGDMTAAVVDSKLTAVADDSLIGTTPTNKDDREDTPVAGI